MRTFIAIDLPNDLKKEILILQSALKRENIFSGNWTSDFHITLKFLGEVDEKKIKSINSILENICGKTKQFELELRSVGAFPSANYIRVVFARVDSGNESAMLLQRQIDSALKKEGFPPEKNYQNHVTLIRVKSVTDKEKLKEIFGEHENQSFGKFTVNKIKLLKSTLTPNGPIYETIKEFILRSI